MDCKVDEAKIEAQKLLDANFKSQKTEEAEDAQVGIYAVQPPVMVKCIREFLANTESDGNQMSVLEGQRVCVCVHPAKKAM